MNRSKKARVGVLEEQRRAFQAAHIPASDLPGFLQAVLDVVGDVAGRETRDRIAGRIAQDKAARVHDLLSTLTAAQLEDVARRAGFPVPDVSNMTAQELARFYFEGRQG